MFPTRGRGDSNPQPERVSGRRPTPYTARPHRLPNTMLKKVKVTLVEALRLCTGRTAHGGSRGIALLFHDQR